MNTLTWFIYLSEVTGNVQGVSAAFSIALFVVTGGWFLVRAIAVGTGDAPDCPRVPKWMPVLGVILAVASVLMPSTKTVRAMAASELALRAYQSEQVKGIVDPGLKYIEKWLKEQIKEGKDT